MEGLVSQDVTRELLLRLGEAGPGIPVHRVNHFEEDDGQDRIHSEETRHNHHSHSHRQVGSDHADGRNPPTVSPPRDAHGLDDVHYNLEEKHEKEEKEAEGTVGPEGPVDGSVPADEGHWSKQDEPQNRQTKVHTGVVVPGEECQAGQHIQEESSTVD